VVPPDLVRLRVLPQHPTTTPDPVDVEVQGPLRVGPVGSRLAVFDYNRELDRTLPPAAPRADGSFPDYEPADARFHQLNAYAVAARAIEIVELELGRGLSWGFSGNRLMLLPHAGYMNNAFYSEDTQSLQFFSFALDDGSVYHTCLVHDIVAHEVGHALLDSIRDRYTEGNDPQTSALHEAFGDLAAVFAALSHETVRVKLLKATKGNLRNENGVASIAEEFRGEGRRRLPLRNLAERVPLSVYEGVVEPHALSLKFTRAVWEAMARMYDINRRAGDDAERALRVARTALQRMVLRGLDYLPPADGTFEDFAKGILRADCFSNPDDALGFRVALAEALVEGGIGKTADALQDATVSETGWNLPRDWPRISPTEAYSFLDRHRKRLALYPEPEFRDFVVSAFHITKKPPELTEIDEVILLYEYPVDVELKGRRFAALQGKWLTIWGGGTLAFGADGILRHHAQKPVTRERVRAACEFIAEAISGSEVAVLYQTEEDEARRATSRRVFRADVVRDHIVYKSNESVACSLAGRLQV
jgi:hypothetical protein